MNFRQVLLASTAAAALLVGLPASGVITPATAQVKVGVSVTMDDLRGRVAPQGEFVKVETIGEVWRPRGLPADWKPYTRGNWIYNSEVGWYFNSDEPFAEVTYHYGRWYEDSNQGWVWVADTKWAPAWVEWRRNKQYVGWRPLPPENAPRRSASRGTTTTVVTGTRSSVAVQEEEWIFVPSNRIVERVDTVMIPRQQVTEVYSQTQVIGRVQERGGIYVNISLQPADLQRDSNITIQSRNLPQAQAVPVPPQVQKISTESRAASSAAPVTPSTNSPAATAPAATTPTATTPAATAPATTAPTAAAPAASTPATSTSKSGPATTPGAAGSSSSTPTPATAGGTPAPAASSDKPGGQSSSPAGVQKNSQPAAAPAPKSATGAAPASSAAPKQSVTPSDAEKSTSTPKAQTAPPAGTKSQNEREPARVEQKQNEKKSSGEKPPMKSEAAPSKAAAPNEKGLREADEKKQAPKTERLTPKAAAPNGPTSTRPMTNEEKTEPDKK